MKRCETRKVFNENRFRERTGILGTPNRNMGHTSMASLKINPAMNSKNRPLTNPANVFARTYLRRNKTTLVDKQIFEWLEEGWRVVLPVRKFIIGSPLGDDGCDQAG